MSKIKLALDVVQDLRRLADSIEALCDGMEGINSAAAEQGREVQPGMEVPQPSLIELRAFVADRSTPETRPLIKAILTKYGVKKLTELPESHYAAFMKEVAAL